MTVTYRHVTVSPLARASFGRRETGWRTATSRSCASPRIWRSVVSVVEERGRLDVASHISSVPHLPIIELVRPVAQHIDYSLRSGVGRDAFRRMWQFRSHQVAFRVQGPSGGLGRLFSIFVTWTVVGDFGILHLFRMRHVSSSRLIELVVQTQLVSQKHFGRALSVSSWPIFRQISFLANFGL